jgi:hypothetical protein
MPIVLVIFKLHDVSGAVFPGLSLSRCLVSFTCHDAYRLFNVY